MVLRRAWRRTVRAIDLDSKSAELRAQLAAPCYKREKLRARLSYINNRFSWTSNRHTAERVERPRQRVFLGSRFSRDRGELLAENP
jgi:hypothetical protein